MKFLLPLILLFSICSCNTSEEDENQGENDLEIQAADTIHFSKIYSTAINDTTIIDSTYLTITISPQNEVNAKFVWVLPLKDGKGGTITGQLNADTIMGKYHYRQEGGTFDDSVRIVLYPEKAVVTQYTYNNYELVDTLMKK